MSARDPEGDARGADAGARDDELIAAWLDGDRRAFDAIVDRYERMVFAVAMRMCADPEDARDVTQEVFISALRALRRFRGDAKLSTWLHRVTVNAALDLGRRKQRRPTSPLEASADRAATGPGPEEQAESAVRAAAVHRALADISDEHRAVIVLHDLRGLDYAEVAETLELPLGTVKSRLHRARVDLAKRLGHLRETEPSQGRAPLTEEP